MFITVKGECFSGAVVYPFQIDGKVGKDKICLSFQKETIYGEFDELTHIITEKANLFEKVTFSYIDRLGTLTLTADDRNVTSKNEVQETFYNSQNSSDFEAKEKHIISPKKAEKLLRTLDFVTTDGKLKNSHLRKYAQVENFIKLLVPYIEKLQNEKNGINGNNIKSNREIFVYDFACGKSYLSFFINYYLTEIMRKKCKIIGLDIRDDVISASVKIRDELKYHNMEFHAADILTYEPGTPIDIALSLHACDTATDYAIAAAVNGKAKIVAVAPCCHKEFLETINSQDCFTPNCNSLYSIMKYGIMKKRFSDILTDVYRAEILTENGYSVTMTEFVSPVETPKNLLILAEKTGRKTESGSYKIERDFNVKPIIRNLLF
jgi:SAM-dependent methyltransferase